MLRHVTTALTLTALLLATGRADDKKDDKKGEQPIKGTWVKDAEGVELAFTFKTKDQLILKAVAGESSVTITCKYKVEKGVVSAEVTDVKEQGDFPSKPAKGYKMKFAFKVAKEVATLSDFDAENKDEVKGIVEGEYKAKKAD